MDNPLDRLAFTTQKEEEYSDTIKELEFNKLARDAENAIMFNRGKMAGEPEAKMREAISVCPECSGAENFQQRVNQLDESVTKEIFGETFGGAFEWAGVTYTQRTEEEFRDMAIASLDATILFDIAEIGLAPLAIIDAVNKVKFLKNAVKLKSFSKYQIR